MILMAGPPACREHGDRSASTDGGVTGKGALGLHPAVLHGEDRPCWWHPGSDLTRHTHRPSQTPCGAPVALCGVLWARAELLGFPRCVTPAPCPSGQQLGVTQRPPRCSWFPSHGPAPPARCCCAARSAPRSSSFCAPRSPQPREPPPRSSSSPAAGARMRPRGLGAAGTAGTLPQRALPPPAPSKSSSGMRDGLNPGKGHCQGRRMAERP